MRLIDADALKDGLKLHYQDTDQKYETDRQWAVGYNAGLERALYSIAYSKTISTPPNPPMTLEELLEMDGEPVYISGKWIDCYDVYCGVSSDGIVQFYKAALPADSYGKTWMSYRRKPDGAV